MTRITIDNKSTALRAFVVDKKTNKTTRVIQLKSSSTAKAFTIAQIKKTAFMRLLPIQTSDIIYEFHFPFSPVNISYEGLSNEIAEMDRPGATAILAYKKHNLLKVSFDFVVAVPYDGLVRSIDNDLALLRKISESVNRPVAVFNLDKMFETTSRRKFQPSNTRHTSYQTKFRIAELSVESVKRNVDGSITQANCSITLIEDVNPRVDVTLIPKFIPPPIPVKPKTTIVTTTATKSTLLSDATIAAAKTGNPYGVAPPVVVYTTGLTAEQRRLLK